MNESLKQTIENLTAESGFCEFKLVPTDHVIFSENVRALCDAQYTDHALNSWSFPSDSETYEECLRKCQHYQWALLVSTISMTYDIQDIKEWTRAGQEMNAMILQLSKELEPYVKDILPLGMTCRRCEQCSYPNEQCRYPEALLPAIEGYGIHIINTMEQEGITGYYDGQTIVCFGIIFLN